MKNALARSALFPALATLLSLATLALSIGAIEFFFRRLRPPPFLLYADHSRYVTSSVNNALKVAAPTTTTTTHIPVNLPVPRFKTEKDPLVSEIEVPPKLDLKMDHGAVIKNRDVGILLRESGKWRTVATNQKGTVVYDRVYTIDEWNRRITPGQERGKREHAMLFFGCSFTFGLGLEDNETLPAAVAKNTLDYRVYNYAFYGWGPGNALRRISKPSFSQEIPEKDGIAIYVFSDWHLTRLVGSFSLNRILPEFRSILPNYYLDETGALQNSGMLEDGRPWETWLFNHLAKSAVLNYFHLEIPFPYGEQHFKLMTSVLKEMKKTLEQKANINKFYVLLYPRSRFAKPLIHYLDEAGIASIDYSKVFLPQYVKTVAIPGEEVHHTAEVQNFLGEQIARDLNLH